MFLPKIVSLCYCTNKVKWFNYIQLRNNVSDQAQKLLPAVWRTAKTLSKTGYNFVADAAGVSLIVYKMCLLYIINVTVNLKIISNHTQILIKFVQMEITYSKTSRILLKSRFRKRLRCAMWQNTTFNLTLCFYIANLILRLSSCALINMRVSLMYFIGNNFLLRKYCGLVIAYMVF